MSRWLCLGCGPSMDTIPPGAMAENIGTCNRGIELFPNPRLYCVLEADAFRQYKRQYWSARRNGTHVITLHRDGNERFQGGTDEVVRATAPDEYDVESWVPGEYRNSITSGSVMVQWVANHGATELNLVGFDGYPPANGAKEVAKTRSYQGPLFKRMAEMLPDVKFIFWSRPNYEVADIPNVIVHDLEPAQSCG